MVFSTEFKLFREKLLDKLLVILPVLTIMAVVSSIVRFYEFGWQPMYYFDLIGGTLLFIIFLFRHKLAYKFKIISLLTILSIAGLLEFSTWGMAGMGILIFGAISVVVTLLIDYKIGMTAFIISLFVIICLSSLMIFGIYKLNIEFGDYHKSISAWLNVFFSFIIFIFPLLYLGGNILQFLLDEVGRRNQTEKELIIAKEEAEKSDKLKSEFLAQMSHEIRTPINALLSFSSLIQDEVGDKVSSDLEDSFQIMRGAGERIIRTIDLILNMSEVQTGSVKLEKQSLNLVKDVIEPIFNEQTILAQSKGLDFSFNVNCYGDVKVFADAASSREIFSNLINNSVKYTEEGFIKIDVERENGYYLAIIEDSGIGISEEYLPHIFTPFSQEDQGYTRKYEGNGLGLSLVKKYCDMNKYDISLQSQKGTGTKITLKINSSESSNN